MHKRSTFRSAPPVLCTTFKVRASVYTDSCNAVQTIHTASIVFWNRQQSNNSGYQITKRIIPRSEQDEHSCSRSSRSCACSRYQGGSKRAMQSQNHVQLPHSSLLSSISVTPSKMTFAKSCSSMPYKVDCVKSLLAE